MTTQYSDAPDDATKMLPESDFIGAWDLSGKPCTLVIRDVRFAHLEKNAVVNQAQRKACIFFETGDGKHVAKGLICGATNLKAVIGLYGKRWKAWLGKPLTIFPTECKSQGGQIVACVRVKPEVPRVKPSLVAPEQPMDQDMRRAQMVGAGEVPPDEQREPGED